ncbi:precorrin-2 C(20)-methyltransferase [cyanobiont of Ornithocercus magnificus]|nr:precorrin-2 C(20)-methyltransferase [cyanobiont of Ornithocercus magnificus]
MTTISVSDPQQSGQLSIVGVGPGDPELITLAAYRAIANADVVAYPVAHAGGDGIAVTIAGCYLNPRQCLLPLHFPMLREDKPRLQAWNLAADILATAVRRSCRVVLLCEGDVSLFATANYVRLALQQRYPNCSVRLIPGIMAVTAAAAAAPWPLAFQHEGLLIRPCPDRREEFIQLLSQARVNETALALLKLGQRWSWVQPLLQEYGLLSNCLFAERIGWPDQVLKRADCIPPGPRPYFSLLLVRQSCSVLLPEKVTSDCCSAATS